MDLFHTLLMWNLFLVILGFWNLISLSPPLSVSFIVVSVFLVVWLVGFGFVLTIPPGTL